MKQWTKKQKLMTAAIFAVVLVAVGVLAAVLNYRSVQAGIKEFKVEIVSERDDYSKEIQFSSKQEYLGEFLRTMEQCEWQDSDYGIYITGFDGIQEDLENQYWWCVMVNGESATMGADTIPIQEGDTYQFVLMQGW